jgi:transposase
VEKVLRRWRERSSAAALPHGGGPKRALKDEAEVIRAAVAAQPDATLKELCEGVEQAGGAQSTPSMMCRELQRLALPRKKSRSTIANAIRHA